MVFLLLLEEGVESARGQRRSIWGSMGSSLQKAGPFSARDRDARDWHEGNCLAEFGIYTFPVPNTCSIGEFGHWFLYVKNTCRASATSSARGHSCEQTSDCSVSLVPPLQLGDRKSEEACLCHQVVSVTETERALRAEGSQAGLGERLLHVVGSATAAPMRGHCTETGSTGYADLVGRARVCSERGVAPGGTDFYFSGSCWLLSWAGPGRLRPQGWRVWCHGGWHGGSSKSQL